MDRPTGHQLIPDTIDAACTLGPEILAGALEGAGRLSILGADTCIRTAVRLGMLGRRLQTAANTTARPAPTPWQVRALQREAERAAAMARHPSAQARRQDPA